jgi:carboxyl-terminal processing protease
MRLLSKLTLILSLCIAVAAAFGTVSAQDGEKVKLSSEAKLARDQTLGMLGEMEGILKEYYYDPKFHGIDLKARIEAAKERVKTMQYNWQMYRVLVQVLMDFNDSHTRMILPPRTDYFQYGFGMQMIGDDCIVTSVKGDSDAHKQGLEVGDQIVSLGKFKPTRRDLWKINYVIYKLDPSKTLDLQVRKPDGTEKAITVTAKTMTDKQYRAELKARKDKSKYEPFKCEEVSSSVLACKFYSFSVEKNDVDKMMTQALKYPKLILDLRGNGGGYVVVEQYLLSHFFDREVKIADLVTRDKTEVRMTKPVGDREYKGEVAVLIDSNSASAAEMTARVLQLEKRAKIYGDFSSGSVMTSITLPFTRVMSALADAAIIQVGMSVTVADVIMRDGSRLENTGVTPDELLQPAGLAYAKKTDPVLAYVAEKFGSPITPEQAGSYHFLVPKDESEDDSGSDDK